MLNPDSAEANMLAGEALNEMKDNEGENNFLSGRYSRVKQLGRVRINS